MRLCYVSPGPLIDLPGQGLALDAKSASGLCAIAARWPGEVLMVSGSTRKPTASDLDLTPVAEMRTAFDVRVADDVFQQASKSGAAVVLALGRLENAPLLSGRARVVFTAETTRSIRTDIALTTGPRGRVHRARVVVGAARRERYLRRMYSRAAGLQCNGFAAFREYGALAPSVFFHDHRVTDDDITRSQDAKRRPTSARLTVAFSGRMTPIKGAADAVHVLKDLRMLADVELVMIGDGEQRRQLEAFAPPEMRFTGALDYRPTWLQVMRSEVDLVVLPHLQGDPSCTYFEALGAGVPVIGYHNETLTPLLNAVSAGKAVPRGDREALVSVAARCAADPSILDEWARAGLRYMRRHSFEQTIDRRVNHLLEVTG